MTRQILMFSTVTLLPVPLLVVSAVWGGHWVLAAYLYLTFFAFALDEIIVLATDPSDPGSEFPAANGLSIILALLHFPLLALGVWALAGMTDLTGLERAGIFGAFGLYFGQVSNSNAHELIHRPQRLLSRLGKWVYISLGYGHQNSAHPHVHHRYAATPLDPNTARMGESYYAFAIRAWRQSFRKGLAAENRMSAVSGRHWRHHPYVHYVVGSAALILASGLFAGWAGVAAYLALTTFSTSQILLSDYVQHYGLIRKELPNGKWAPVTDRHSWNAPHWFSGLLMLNAPRHADHHAHPNREYPALRLPPPEESPTLPHSLPAMGCLALIPSLWRKSMDDRARAWRDDAVSVAH